eukprot:g3357.t1
MVALVVATLPSHEMGAGLFLIVMLSVGSGEAALLSMAFMIRYQLANYENRNPGHRRQSTEVMDTQTRKIIDARSTMKELVEREVKQQLRLRKNENEKAVINPVSGIAIRSESGFTGVIILTFDSALASLFTFKFKSVASVLVDVADGPVVCARETNATLRREGELSGFILGPVSPETREFERTARPTPESLLIMMVAGEFGRFDDAIG